jgi:hypothetical protein
MGLFCFFYMLEISGGHILATSRNIAITQVIPAGKYIFGISEVSLVFAIVFASILVLQGRGFNKIIGLLIILISSFIIILLYQRGILVFSITIVLWLYEKFKGKVSLKLMISFLVAGLLIIVLARPISDMISATMSGQMQIKFLSDLHERFRLTKAFLYSPDFSQIDVFIVALKYQESEGLLWGKNFLGWIVRFLPFQVRTEIASSGVDLLNSYIYDISYQQTGFGFNVGLPHDLFLSFGWIGLFLMIIPGYISGRLDRWLETLSPNTVWSVTKAIAVLWTGGLMGETGGIIQWFFTYLLFGAGMSILVRILQTSALWLHRNDG